MATYVLVHGGSHGGWCYQRVARILRASGHDVYAPTLTGLGERAHLLAPGVDLDTHITDVVQLLAYEGLFDVILVGHSYGGMVITGAADRALDRVGHLVYLDAATPANGQSLAGLAPELMAASRAMGRVVDGVELVNFPGEGPMPHYGLTDPDDIAWLAPKITPHPWKCFDQPLRLHDEAGVRALPQSQIVCTSTLPYRDPADLEPARTAGRLWDIDTGHDLMVSEPQAVAGFLELVAAATAG